MHALYKILAKKAGKKEVVPGEIVIADVDVVVLHDFGTYLISNVLEKEIKDKKILDPDKVVVVFDHLFSPPDENKARILRHNREFVTKYNIRHFYDGGSGICHYVLLEEGFARPGMIVGGSDSHTTGFGAIGAFATGLGNNSIAGLFFSKGKAWYRVPEVAKVQVEGKLPNGVTVRDVIQAVIREVGEDGAVYEAIEYAGELVRSMSVMDRFVLCLQAVEMGAKTGFVQPDEKVVNFIRSVTDKPFEILQSDDEQEYTKIHEVDVSSLEPQVTCPSTVGNVRPISDVVGVRIDQAEIGGCTGGRIEDFRLAAEILRGRKKHPDVRLSVVPGSRKIFQQMLKEGLIDVFLRAGANIFPPSCGSCQTVNMGALTEEETMIFTQPRNFPGRTGSPKAKVYIASPLTVAASAIKGEITDPREFLE